MAAIVIRRSLALVVAFVSASIPKIDSLAPCAMWLGHGSTEVAPAPAPVEVRTETFVLTHTKAADVAEDVIDLFEPPAETLCSRGRRPFSKLYARGQLRSVIANDEENSVSITAEAIMLVAIGKLVREEWDLPRESKVYTLEHIDAGAVAGKLRALLDSALDERGRRSVNPITSEIEPCPETNKLVVVYRTSSRGEAALEYLDEFVAQLDRTAEPVIELDADAQVIAELSARAAEDLPPRMRVAPLVCRNALAIVGLPEAHRESIRELVEWWDRPIELTWSSRRSQPRQINGSTSSKRASSTPTPP